MSNWPKVNLETNKELTLCFGCGKENPIGMKLKFAWTGETATAEFTPSEFYQGWTGIVHGGIMQCLLDEAMSYATKFAGLHCLTAEMKSRLKRPALIGEPLVINAAVTDRNRKLVRTKATITLRDGTVVAEATATQFIFKREALEKSVQ
ncbi:MAG: PaaI family thioesterase [Chloroflexi bacterium]|nr:PaaI family thioesterase [Chloroflexota bacterium]